MNRFAYCLLLATVTGLAGGCTQQAPVSDPRIPELERKVIALEQRLTTLDDKVKALEQQQEFEDLFDAIRTMAILRPGDAGYSVVESDLGKLTVKLEDVQPFANGTRVKLRFGNISAVAINGVKATFEYGPTDDKGAPKNEVAMKKDVTFVETLRPGAWTLVTLTLDGIQPANLGFIRIKNIGHQAIQLQGGR